MVEKMKKIRKKYN